VLAFLLENFWESMDLDRLSKKKVFFHLACSLGVLPVVEKVVGIYQLDLQEKQKQQHPPQQRQNQRGKRQPTLPVVAYPFFDEN